jgi:predicted RNA binding protein YcfA (HicA-like mRNA interferase family)
LGRWTDHFPRGRSRVHQRFTIRLIESDLPDSDNLGYPDLESIGENLIEPGASLPDLSQLIVQMLGGAHSGAPLPYTDRGKMPPPDCLAFYLPFHYYHPTWWGVYLLLEGVIWLAGEIVRRSGGSVSNHRAMQSARLFLYYHEAFHHKTECFATRLELTHRTPFYKTGFERLYQKTFGTEGCREEGLANASALADSKKRLSDPVVDNALEKYVLDSPPGYDQGVRMRRDFQTERCAFAEENQRICLPHLRGKHPDVWRTTPHMFDGIANIKSRVNYMVPRSSPLAARLPFRPLLPPMKLVKKLTELANLEFVRNGGNHDIYRTPSGRSIQIPRHARDLGRGLVRKIIREAGLEMGLEEFLQQ